MELIYLLLVIFLVIPAAALIGCAVMEASLMKNRPQLSWLLPAAAMLAPTLFPDTSSGLTALLCPLLDFYGRFALYGTTAGAVIGAVLRWFKEPKRLNQA